MDLKNELDSISTNEVLYTAAGILLIAVAAYGLQYQNTPETGEETMEVSLNIDKANNSINRDVNIPVNSTVFDAVNQTFEVEYTEYDFGYFVTSIDGLGQNETHSWLYSVNNQSATTAVNNYVLSDSDQVTFRHTNEELE